MPGEVRLVLNYWPVLIAKKNRRFKLEDLVPALRSERGAFKY